MAEVKLSIKLKHDTEANWLKATTFKPLKGELIIYDVDSTHSAPRFKVGDGVNVVGDLPFADKDLAKLGDINADFLSDLLVAGAGISINKQANADKIEVKIDSSRSITATGFVASENGMSVSLYSDNIQYYDYYGNSYMYTFPSKNGTLTTDNSFKTINGNSIVGSGDITVATLAADNTFTGINIFHKEETSTSGDKTISEAKIDPGPTAPLILLETKTVASDGLTITGNATIRPDSIVLSDNGMGYTTSITHDGFTADYSGIYTKYYTGSIVHNTASSGAERRLTFPDKSGTLALTSDVPSFNNFTLLTSKPSDWATNYDTYYKKGDFGFFRNLSDSTWAANKFYSAVPAEIDIQTLTQPIKIQVSGTPGWGVYGGLNLSYGKAKLYGIDNSFEDNVGYIDISNGNLTSAVYNADFTLSNPAARGYGFSVKDTSTLFSVGLNKSQAGDYAEQYYCNINAPLNVTQIHGFTQLTDQPSDWSTKYSSYYAGFDAFNGNSRFWGRSDGLYKPTNDILLNVGTGHKIKIAGLYGSLGTDEIRNSITLSNSGINLKHEVIGATSTLDILPNNINIKSDGLKLSASNDEGYIELGSVGTIDLKGNFPVTITSDASKVYGTNMFKLTVSGQQAIGVDTFSTSSNNLIRFEMTPKFNTNKIRGMAGVDLSLPASAGILAHIPTGTAASSILFGDNNWQTPVTINGNTFKSMAGKSIYAPTSTPEFYSNAQTNMTTAFCTFTKGANAPTFLAPSSLVNRYVLETHAKIGNGTEVSWTINYGLKANFTSFTIGTSHKNGYLVTKTCNVADFLYKINSAYVNVSDSGSSFQFRITNMGTSSTTFGIKNNSYTNLTGEFFIVFHYVF